MPGIVKKKLVVVKSLRDLSPKKQLLVSHNLNDEDKEDGTLAQSSFGNHSPTVSMDIAGALCVQS